MTDWDIAQREGRTGFRVTEAMMQWREWPIVTHEDFGPGVYAIWRASDDSLFYVGHTKSCWSRIRSHVRTGFCPPHYRIHWKPMATQVAANLLEYAMIQEFRPIYNRNGYKRRAKRFVAAFVDRTSGNEEVVRK